MMHHNEYKYKSFYQKYENYFQSGYKRGEVVGLKERVRSGKVSTHDNQESSKKAHKNDEEKRNS
jgi:uncharacterized protein YeaO (DUF488 family)